jgi:ATP-dependent DNA helicase RecG
MANPRLHAQYHIEGARPLSPDDYQAASAVIAESINLGRIAAANPDQGRRNAKYVPYRAI